MIKVAILDDHNLVLRGLESMLQDSEEVKIVASYSLGQELLEKIPSIEVDVLLLDINLPDSNGIELCKDLSQRFPEMAILALSNHSETGFIKNMLRNGASGYLLKNTDKKELLTAIVQVAEGTRYLPAAIQNILLNDSIGNPVSNSFIPKLTRREKEVLELIARENTNQEIAESLFISPKTVENHRSNLIQKLGVKNTAGLVRVAYEKGLLA